MKWDVLYGSPITNHKSLITALLENRGLKSKKEIDEFLNPTKNIKLDIPKNILKRLNEAKKNKEKIVIFGDYDCDGVCATAILWETMYKEGFDVMPYIPDRFEEGYGIKSTTFANSKFQNLNPNLIITVDNGIVAYDAIKEAKKRGIDVIVVDHHALGNKKLTTPYILHSTIVCGSALAWFLSRELSTVHRSLFTGLDLVALGTVADQIPLLGINRSIVKYGLEELNNTKRLGLRQIVKDVGVQNVGVYEIGFMIAPRINASGRLLHAIDALRLLCTKDPKKAKELSKKLSETNIERQKIVEGVVARVLEETSDGDKIMVISGDYHEGVIGLASGKVTEKYYKPSIVLSVGKEVSKASARSINGFNIIEAIKETNLILEGGGHPMAAGFSIETSKISEFKTKINEISKKYLTDEILEKKLKIDLELDFKYINIKLIEILKKLEPFGYGNSQPVFTTKKVKVVESKTVGSDGKHLKLKLEQNGIKFDGIWFNNNQTPIINNQYDIAFTIEENIWNNKTLIQLKIKDIKY
jgi:single-stranded-DNA-specific exonuclease